MAKKKVMKILCYSPCLFVLTCCREGSVLDLAHNCHRVLLRIVRVLAHIVLRIQGQRLLFMTPMNLIRASLDLQKLPLITME